MTREEAIAILIREIDEDIFVRTEYREQLHEALNMGIKALKQEPCEDAISRQAAIELVSTMYLGNDSNSSYRTDGDTGDTLVGKFQVMDGLSDLPTVTPKFTDVEIQKMQEMEQAEIQKAYELGKAEQPKTGHWMYTLEDWNKWECSECGFTKRTDVHVSIGYKFCPKCGAKMESEVKS